MRYLPVALVIFALGSPVVAQDSPDEAWEDFIFAVSKRSDADVLACYAPKLREQLSRDNHAAGRARLDMHMADLFSLLCRDYDYEIVDREEGPDKATLTVEFRRRNREEEEILRRRIEMVYGEDRWLIASPPEGPPMLGGGKGNVKMLLGIGAAALLFIGLLKKALG